MNKLEELQLFFSLAEAKPHFTSRPVNIPGDFRFGWRLALVCLLLSRARGKTLTLRHLHVLWWAIRNVPNRELFLRWMSGEKKPDELIVRFDPTMATTIDLALGEKLVERTTAGHIKLSGAGDAFAKAVLSTESVLQAEKEFLFQIPSNLSQRRINDLLEWK